MKSPSRLAVVGWIVLALLATAVVAWAIDYFLEISHGRHWGEAIQATTTTALVLITAYYAYFTNRMARNQELDMERRAAEQQVSAAADMVGYTLESRIYNLSEIFPASGTPPSEKLLTELTADWLDTLIQDLRRQADQLPAKVEQPFRSLIECAERTRLDTKELLLAIQHELSRVAEPKDFDWERAREYYAGTLREARPDSDKREWKALVEGFAVRDLHDAQRAALSAAQDWLGLGPLPKGTA